MVTPYRILVVDDEEILRSALNACLTHAGHEVVEVESGEEALVRLEVEHFDLVLTDHRMPGMTGQQLAATVKASRPSLPVILFTGYAEEVDMSCLDLVLSKPGDLPNLVGSVRAILDGARV